MHSYQLTHDQKKMKAFLTIHEIKDIDVTPEQVLEYLMEVGIIIGVDEKAVHRMVNERQWDEPILVATGIEPIAGEDGRIDYKFDTELSYIPKRNEDGSVDFFVIKTMVEVSKGQELAIKILPTEGTPGKTVYNDIVPSKPGKEKRLYGSDNTSFADPEKTILVADKDGHVKVTTLGEVHVDEVLMIKRDVDFSTGNLDFKGHIVIRGDVKAGFKVAATESIEIWGTVEDAKISGGGDVMIKGGFVGNGKGEVSSQKNVVIRYVRNQQVYAKQDIVILDSSMNSTLVADRAIILNKGRGAMVSGTAQAAKYIIAKTIGNEKQLQTKVSVGKEFEQNPEIRKLNVKIEQIDTNITKIEPMMHEYKRKRDFIGLPPDLEKTSYALEKTYKNLLEELNFVKEAKKELLIEDKKRKDEMYIKILKEVYPGTNLAIAGAKLRINKKKGLKTFKIMEGEIIET